MTMQESLDDRRREGSPARLFTELDRRPSISAGIGGGTEGIIPQRPMAQPTSFAPAGEMIGERMADRQAGPLMPGGTFTGGLGEDPYKLFDIPFTDQFVGLDPVNAPKVGLPSGAGTYGGYVGGMTPDYMSSQLNFPSIAPQTDIQDILRRGGPPYNPISDYARTTTMGTGWQKPQPPVDPWDYNPMWPIQDIRYSESSPFPLTPGTQGFMDYKDPLFQQRWNEGYKPALINYGLPALFPFNPWSNPIWNR